MSKEAWISVIASAIMAGLSAAVGVYGNAALWVVIATGVIAFCGTLVAGLRIPRPQDAQQIRDSLRPRPLPPPTPPPTPPE